MNALFSLALMLLGDVGLKQGGTVLGPARDLNCTADAGIFCSRNTSAARADLACIAASPTETGCVTPGTQTLAGDKTITGTTRLTGQTMAGYIDAGVGKIGNCILVNGVITCTGANFGALDAGTARIGYIDAGIAGIGGCILAAGVIDCSSEVIAPNALFGALISTSGSMGNCSFAAGTAACSPSTAAAFVSAPNGWLEMFGTTTTAISSQTPTAGSGAFQYDTVTTKLLGYENGAWRNLMTSASKTSGSQLPFDFMAAYCKGTCANSTNFLGPQKFTGPANSVTVGNIACSWDTAGAGGATGVVAQLYDTTANAEVCSCNIGACAATAKSPLSCACNTALATSTHFFVLRLKSTTDCESNPQEIMCNVQGTYTP